MSIYLIGYDLTSGQDYSEIIEEIKSFGTWWHGLDSTWMIKSTKDVTAIRNQLKAKLPSSDDSLLVLRYVTSEETGTGSAAWTGFSNNANDWLKKHL